MSSTGPFGAIISGLDDDTIYHFRAVAENGKGKRYGPDMSFKISKKTYQAKDILAVLEAYFKGKPSALLGGKVPTVDDIFNLLNAYF